MIMTQQGPFIKVHSTEWNGSYPTRDLHLFCAPMINLLQRKKEVSFNGCVLLLGTTSSQPTKPHAEVTVHSVIKFCNGKKCSILCKNTHNECFNGKMLWMLV